MRRVLLPGAQVSRNCRWIRTTFKLFGMALILVLVLVMYANKVQYESMQEMATQGEIVMLQSKLKFLEFQNQMKQDFIKSLKNKMKTKCKNMDNPEESHDRDSVYDKIVTLIREKSGNFTFVKPVQQPEPIQASIWLTAMPHLLRSSRSTCPTVQISSPRNSSDIDVVIGIPTVKRDVEYYLADTIRSLINGMTPEELKKTLIIVSIGETDDLNYIADTVYSLNFEFEACYGEVIEVISPSKYWYPDWDALQPTLGDSQKRSRWRTKQNLDAVFLISYAQSRGSYYLMLEDDVVAKKGYMTAILRFATNQSISNPHWFFINFSSTGGIGKFFRMKDLSFFSAYLQVLYMYMPIDWLIELYLAGRVCGLDKSSKKCEILKNIIRPTYKIPLFDHAGMYSSLRGKIHRVKPSLRNGKSNQLFIPHNNPPLKSISTTLESVRGHSIEGAYAGDDFYWGKNPKVNDTVEFQFDSPLKLNKFFFRTGNTERKSDVIKNGAGVVEVLSKDYTYVSKFDEFGNSEGKIDPKLWPIKSIRIKILQNLTNWIIISEINLNPLETT